MKLGIPEEIQRIIGKETYSLDKVGMSGSEVRIYDNHVLKIEPQNEETDNVIIPELSEPPVRTLGATIPENESRLFR